MTKSLPLVAAESLLSAHPANPSGNFHGPKESATPKVMTNPNGSPLLMTGSWRGGGSTKAQFLCLNLRHPCRPTTAPELPLGSNVFSVYNLSQLNLFLYPISVLSFRDVYLKQVTNILCQSFFICIMRTMRLTISQTCIKDESANKCKAFMSLPVYRKHYMFHLLL